MGTGKEWAAWLEGVSQQRACPDRRCVLIEGVSHQGLVLIEGVSEEGIPREACRGKGPRGTL